MSNSQFLDTNFNGGLQAPHYFNGRLLTAEDLKTDQEAVHTREAWLGKASGYGVIEGFMVTQIGKSNSLQITAGLGLNRQGQILHLPNDPILDLALPASSSVSGDDAGLFKNCDFSGTSGGTGVVSDGAYLLTAIPASRLDGLVPMKGVAGSKLPPGCGSKLETKGLQFKAIRLTGFEAEVANITNNNRRNLLAHWCYGSKHLPDLARDPFHFTANFGGLDSVDSADLTPADLPLAVFYWQGGTLIFVDAWSARRRLIRPDALDETQESVVIGRFGFTPLVERLSTVRSQIILPGPLVLRPSTQQKTRTWKGILSDKRVAEGQARFLQFQAEIDALMSEGKARRINARGHFPLMPPAGFLPIKLDFLLQLAGMPPLSKRIEEVGWATLIASAQKFIARSVKAHSQFIPYLKSLLEQRLALSQKTQANLVNWGTEGFDPRTFFGGLSGLSINGALADGETVDFTLQHSWYDEAIDLTQYSTTGVEEAKEGSERSVLNLLFVTENLASPYDQPYLIFVKAMRPIVWY